MCNSWFISSLILQIFLPSLPEDLVFSGFHIYLFPSSWWLESTSNSASLEIGYWLGVHCLYFLSTQRQWSFFLMEGPSAFKAICQLCPFHFRNWFDLRFQVCQVNVSVVSLNFESKMLKKKKSSLTLTSGEEPWTIDGGSWCVAPSRVIVQQDRPCSRVLELCKPPQPRTAQRSTQVRLLAFTTS